MPVITDPQLHQVITQIANELGRECNPQHIGFAMFLFRVDHPDQALFATSVDRDMMVDSVGRWVDQERAKRGKV